MLHFVGWKVCAAHSVCFIELHTALHKAFQLQLLIALTSPWLSPLEAEQGLGGSWVLREQRGWGK